MATPSDTGMPPLKYLAGYPAELLTRVHDLIRQGRLGEWVRQRHPAPHQIRTDKALYEHVSEMKARHMRNAPPLDKVAYDPQLQRVQQALGTHTAVSRPHGNRLKAKREIRIASVFKDGPEDLLKMIVVHELAHLRERDHDKAFYALCQHMETDYHQLEFDARLWLTAREIETARPPGEPRS